MMIMSSYTSRKVMEIHVERFFLPEKMSKKFWLTWKTCQKVDRFVSKENCFFRQKHHQTQFLLYICTYFGFSKLWGWRRIITYESWKVKTYLHSFFLNYKTLRRKFLCKIPTHGSWGEIWNSISKIQIPYGKTKVQQVQMSIFVIKEIILDTGKKKKYMLYCMHIWMII